MTTDDLIVALKADLLGGHTSPSTLVMAAKGIDGYPMTWEQLELDWLMALSLSNPDYPAEAVAAAKAFLKAEELTDGNDTTDQAI